MLVFVSSVQWAPLTSASITCQQAAAAWAAPTASLLRTPLTCTERVTRWVAAQTPWRNGRGPSAAPAPSGTAQTKVGHALKHIKWNVFHKWPSYSGAIRDNFRATSAKAESLQSSSALIADLMGSHCVFILWVTSLTARSVLIFLWVV